MSRRLGAAILIFLRNCAGKFHVMGTLYIVATPIGNLEDITLRALRVLKEVNIVLAEDTRVAKKLCCHFKIEKPIRRYDEHVAAREHESIQRLLEGQESIALLTDAGTPGISDPGARLVAYIRANNPEILIVPIPGPSALITALSAAGVDAGQFTFLGYPPHKKGRKTFFENLSKINIRPIVLYESPHRLQKTLKELGLASGPEQRIIIAKELTKIFESITDTTAGEAQSIFTNEKAKGEFVLIVP